MVDVTVMASGEVARLHELVHPGDDTLLTHFWQDSSEAMQLVAPDRTVLAMNPAARATFSPSTGEVGERLPSAPVSLTDDAGLPLAPDRWPTNVAFRGEVSRRQVVHLDLGDGVRQKLVSAFPVRLNDDRTAALIVWHDITDSWRPADRTKGELVRLRTLLEGATDHALILMDVHGRVRSWSDAAEKLYGYAESVVSDMHYATFFEPGDRAAGVPEQVLAQAVTAGRSVAEGKRLRADGSLFWAHCVVSAIRADDGALNGFVMVAHDVSERRAAEGAIVRLNDQLKDLNEDLERRVQERTRQLQGQAAELAAANRELEAFSYSVSHDLRAPLRSMAGFTTILREEFGSQLPDAATHYLERVNESAVQMGSLIDALLAFSRMQRQSLSTDELDMTALAAQCWEGLAPFRQDRRVEFVLHPLPPARGDRRLIQQVWSNLLENALKYTSRNPTARIEVLGEMADGEIRYVVQDDGAGFDERFADKLGQVFQRLHRAEDFPGNGVGLALVERIVLRHGGRLTAAGAVGKGARFAFSVDPGR